MPYEAWLSLDAIARTLWRMAISHRHMLEWTPSSQASGDTSSHLDTSYRAMWVNPALAAIMAGLLWWVAPDTLWIAAPILWLWLIAPAIAWWISLPLPRELPNLSPDQHAFLHRLARKTWAFFDTYLGPDEIGR